MTESASYGQASSYYTHRLEVVAMNVDRMVFAFAGCFILLSLALSQLHSVYWLWFTAFVGVNMLQAAFTGFCPLAMILKKVGLKAGCAFS
tara:strand:+ start:19444 stop:19713 length:270 start_codon:yes stop_codon:yes gene_type:complete